MRTIYPYEMKRVLCNKLFAAMLLITCAYSYVVLNNTIKLGVAYTAPLFPVELRRVYRVGRHVAHGRHAVFLWRACSPKKERMTQIVTLATPVNTVAYTLPSAPPASRPA